MNFTHYLPDTEKRIETLRQVINQRTVAIVLQGFSVTELENRIGELKDLDICYASVNSFSVIERNILQKIDRNCSIILCSSPSIGIDVEIKNIIRFLERQENNLFISVKMSFYFAAMPQWFDFNEFMSKYNEKLLFNDLVFPVSCDEAPEFFNQFPSVEFPLHFVSANSLSILLSLIVIGGASRVVIFGGDGGGVDPGGLYFRESELGNYPELGDGRGLFADTKTFNERMLPLLGKIYKIYGLQSVEIINCSQRSHYTPFRKLSYNETFSLLKGDKDKI